MNERLSENRQQSIRRLMKAELEILGNDKRKLAAGMGISAATIAAVLGPLRANVTPATARAFESYQAKKKLPIEPSFNGMAKLADSLHADSPLAMINSLIGSKSSHGRVAARSPEELTTRWATEALRFVCSGGTDPATLVDVWAKQALTFVLEQGADWWVGENAFEDLSPQEEATVKIPPAEANIHLNGGVPDA